MNKIYRLIWSQVLNTWVCCAENAKGRGKSGSPRKLIVGSVAFAGSALLATAALAAPTGGQISAGSGTISQAGLTTNINQSSQNLAVNWQSFNIAANETVNFLQPSSTAIAVNRIFSTNGSQILGNLNANGQIYLINPNGIIFGAGAQVNVGGMVASTLDMTNAANGKVSFAGSGTGSIVNQGRITAANGGYVAFIGNTVSNTGSIAANFGSVALGAGNAVTLTFAGNSLVQMQVDQSVLNSLANNGGLIQANGGMVILTAGARDALLASVVNNTGVIEAQTVQNQSGKIILLGGMAAGTVNVGGTLDASAPSPSASLLPLPQAGEGLGRGGVIETSAAHVHVANDTKVTTLAGNGLNGTWLIDPVDFTIAASGGDMTGAAVNAALAGGNVSILSSSGATGTAGNVNVNDAVSWSANQLTLNAQNNININSAMNASGIASLALLYGQGALAAGNTSNIATGVNGVVNLPAGTTNFTTLQGSDGVTKNYTVITALGAAGSVTGTDLQGMNGNRAGNYALGGNIDASGTSNWNAGFATVGSSYNSSFSGIFDGLGHTITGITINRTGTNGIGLFGYGSAASVISNVGVVGGSVAGGTGNYVGGLAGMSFGVISNSYATDSVSSTSGNHVGGLVGYGKGTISNSYATGNVSSTSGVFIGGLVGYNLGTISNSYATGSVTGTFTIGGLVGDNNGTISNSYATGSVSGGWRAGGLVGTSYGTVSNSFATGNVSGSSNLGGLVGHNSNGTISNSYATGSVSGSSYLGGLVGDHRGTISNSYATGNVSGVSYVGGLVGKIYSGTISNSFWDTQTSGQATSAGGLGLATAQMKSSANFNSATAANGNVNPAWDFANTWVMYNGYTAPLLRSFLTPLTVTANNATKTYDGLVSTATGVTYSTIPNSNLFGTLNWGGAKNVGIYAASGLYSNQQGYLITYVNGTLTVNAAPLTTTTTSTTAGSTTASAVSTGLESSFGGQSMGGQSTGGNSSGSLSAMPGVSSTITLLTDKPAEDADGTNPAGNSSPLGAASMLNTALAFGTTGSLQIVNGGVNAPDSGMNVFLSRRDGN